jgi:hypothetical protein
MLLLVTFHIAIAWKVENSSQGTCEIIHWAVAVITKQFANIGRDRIFSMISRALSITLRIVFFLHAANIDVNGSDDMYG